MREEGLTPHTFKGLLPSGCATRTVAQPLLTDSQGNDNVGAQRRGKMLEAIPTNIFSTTFRLHQQNQLVGEIDTSIWREKATLELPDGTYQLYREGTFNGDFLLEHNGKVAARATKPSAFQSRFEVEVAGRVVELRKLSIWNRNFGVFDGERQVGGVYPLGLFTRRAKIDLPDDWPLAATAFVFWLAFIMWRRQNSAAASS